MTGALARYRAAFRQNWLSYIFLALVVMGGAKGVLNRLHPAASVKDTISWKQLGKAKLDGNKAVYTAYLQGQDGKHICISGYMFPLQGAKDQAHFLLSAYQPTCPFCLPGGPKDMIEVTDTAENVSYGLSAVTLCGRLHLLKTQEELQTGMLFQMSGASAAK